MWTPKALLAGKTMRKLCKCKHRLSFKEKERLPGRWKQDSRRVEPRAMENYSQIGGGLNQETSNIFTGRFQNWL